MKKEEITTATRVYNQCLDELRLFYNAIVPQHYRSKFNDLAKESHLDLLTEILELKEKLKTYELDIQDYCLNVRIYQRKYKDLIRMVGIKLLIKNDFKTKPSDS